MVEKYGLNLCTRYSKRQQSPKGKKCFIRSHADTASTAKDHKCVIHNRSITPFFSKDVLILK